MNASSGSSKAPVLGSQISPHANQASVSAEYQYYHQEQQQQQFQQQQEFYQQQLQQNFHNSSQHQNYINHQSNAYLCHTFYLGEPDSLRSLNNVFGPHSDFTTSSGNNDHSSFSNSDRLSFPPAHHRDGVIADVMSAALICPNASHTASALSRNSQNMVSVADAQQIDTKAMNGYNQVRIIGLFKLNEI